MVAKRISRHLTQSECIILAKIHMVAKLNITEKEVVRGIILAKIHMVAKPALIGTFNLTCIILAKIHMVAKPQKYYSITFDIKIYQSFTF